MVERRLSDGTRVAQLLASEIDGLGGPLEPASVVDADPDVEPTPDGAFAYAVAVETAGERSDVGSDEDTDGDEAADSEKHENAAERIAAVFVQPERVRVEFTARQQRSADAATRVGLRVRPKASRPPRTLVFVEDGAEVKRTTRVFETVVDAGE